MRWQEKSVSFEELSSVTALNKFINRPRDRTFASAIDSVYFVVLIIL